MWNDLTFLFIIVLAVFAYLGWLHRTKDPEEFHTDRRQVGGFRTATSIFTIAGAPHFAFITALAYFTGWWVVSLYAGSVIGFLILSAVSSKIRSYIPKDAQSFPDVASEEIGQGAAGVLSLLGTIFLLGVIAAQLVVGGTLLAAVADINYYIAVLLMTGGVLLYLWWGGYRALLFTDAIQAIAMLALTAAFVWYIWDKVSVADVWAMAGPARVPNPLIPLIPMLGLAGIILELGAPSNWQRILTAETNGKAIRGLWGAGLLYLSWGLLVVAIGNAIAALLPDANPQEAFVQLVSTGLPSWMIGLVSVLLLTALVSTADSALFVGTVICNKEVGRLMGHGERPLTISQSRWYLTGLAALSLVAALGLRDISTVFGVLLNIGFILGPIMFWIVLGRGGATPRIRRQVFAVALSLAMLAFVAILIWADGDFFTWWSLLIVLPGSLPVLISGGRMAGDSDSAAVAIDQGDAS